MSIVCTVSALIIDHPRFRSRLDARVKHEPDNYVKMIEAYTASTYGRTDFKPTEWGGKQDGVYYLSEVDELGKRSYKVHAA